MIRPKIINLKKHIKMKNNILAQIDNPVQLEKLYRENNNEFKKHFNEIYPMLVKLQVVFLHQPTLPRGSQCL